MMVIIENFLTTDEVAEYRARLLAGCWIDGTGTAGEIAQQVKRNLQLDDNDPAAQAVGQDILGRMGRHPTVISAALPEKILPPRFNRYRGGGHYGAHIDSAVMRLTGTNQTMRTDLSVTLFLTDPDNYDGGELLIEGNTGVQPIKLAAGDMVIYPATTLHQVTPVTRGERLSAFFWIQSMVRDDSARTMLYDLDRSIQSLRRSHPANDPDILCLTGVYHNLLRRWVSF